MGVTPGWGGAVQLAELVGKREALKILASSKKILPTQALDMGLVDEIIPQDTVSCWNCLFTWSFLVFPERHGRLKTLRLFKRKSCPAENCWVVNDRNISPSGRCSARSLWLVVTIFKTTSSSDTRHKEIRHGKYKAVGESIRLWKVYCFNTLKMQMTNVGI